MKRSRNLLIVLALSGLVWLGYAIVANWVARYASAHFSAAVARLTLGYATDAGDFVKYRLRDAALLLTTLALVLVLPGALAEIFSGNGARQNRRWILPACALFVLANLWLAVACHTTLFWLAFWEGRNDTSNLVRIETKELLLRESRAGLKAAILGNSQAHRQLNDQFLNELLTTNLHTSELHWPGSHGYDIYLVHHNLDPAAAQVMICYVSEMNFYEGVAADSVPLFFGFKNIRDFKEFNLAQHVPARDLGYGLLSDALPAFYLRNVVSQRLLGLGLVNVRQRAVSTAASGDADPAGRWAASFQNGANAAFQKSAFAAFAQECADRHEQLVVIAGQVNPLVSRRLDPALRADMMDLLHELQRRFPNFHLIENPPAQDASEYADLTHVNAECRAAFTRFVAGQLQAMILTNAAAPGSMEAGRRFQTTATTP